jgi:DinB superfamily
MTVSRAVGGHVEHNDESRQRLAALLDRLGGGDAELEIDDTWTVGALLAHLAFWDRLVQARWEYAIRTGAPTPPGLDEVLTDFINDASISIWRGIDPGRLAAVVTSAAETVDALIAGLPAGSVEAIAREGRPRLLDRSFHRSEHIAAIEGRLAAR